MIIRKEIDFSQPLTPEQLKMLEEVEKRPVVPDEDCPELTDEQLNKSYRASQRKSQTVTLTLSEQALEKAKSLGSGYTSILSKLLENALNDNELLKKCL